MNRLREAGKTMTFSQYLADVLATAVTTLPLEMGRPWKPAARTPSILIKGLPMVGVT